MDVKIKSEGVNNVQIMAGGVDLAKVARAVRISMEAGDVARAEVDLSFVQSIEVSGKAVCLGPHGKAVQRIEYTDGTVEEYGPEGVRTIEPGEKIASRSTTRVGKIEIRETIYEDRDDAGDCRAQIDDGDNFHSLGPIGPGTSYGDGPAPNLVPNVYGTIRPAEAAALYNEAKASKCAHPAVMVADTDDGTICTNCGCRVRREADGTFTREM